MVGSDINPDGGPQLNDRLAFLFDRIRDPGGDKYTLREVADAISAQAEAVPALIAPLSHTFLGQLCTGERDNPTVKQLRGLARFFGVPIESFTSTRVAAEVDKELDLLAMLQEVQARTVALRQTVIPQAEETIEALTGLLGAIKDMQPDRPSAPTTPDREA
jgi:transcriptional regulator with XRE-family HTH domain